MAEYGRQAAGRHPRTDYLRLRRGELGQKARRTGRRRRRDGDLPSQKGHPGVFDRRIFVYTQLSDKEPTAILSLRGAVTASVRTDDDYPHAMGALRLKQRTVRFGRTDKVQSERIECLNAGDKPLTPVCDEGFAATGLSFACEPATLAPGAKGDLVVRFDPAKAPQPLRRTPLPVGGPDVPPSQRMLWIEFGETE